MSKSELVYLCLKPTKDSRFGFNESKELIAYLGDNHQDFELIVKSQNNQGIELFIAIEPRVLSTVIKHIYSICPNLVITKVKKSKVILKRPTKELAFGLNKHYAYPLFIDSNKDKESLTKLLRNISQLADREAIEIIFNCQPSNELKTRFLRWRLLGGHRPPTKNNSLLARLVGWLVATLSGIASLAITILQLISLSDPKFIDRPRSIKVVGPKAVLLLDKLYQQLFKVNMTVKIKSSSFNRTTLLEDSIRRALNSFAREGGYQEFSAKNNLNKGSIYSTGDLAALYHFDQPNLDDGVFKMERFKTLPKLVEHGSTKRQPGDIVIGQNSYQGVNRDINIKRVDRYRHMYISGATGSGKSTLLANLILQDINSGQGLSLIDPHGDLAQAVLSRIPIERQSDVIYFDPADPSSDLTINLLELKSKHGSLSFKAEAEKVTETVISLFRKVFGEDLNSHRIEYILRNSIQTSLMIPDSTIFTIFRLLTDASFRLKQVQRLTDQNLINFWHNELGRAGDYQRVKMTAGVTAKVGRFLFSGPAQRVFGSPTTTLDIGKVMDDGKILICNLSRGQLGEDGSRLFATSLLTKLQLSALARAEINPAKRLDHYLYIDEFQNHTPSSLVQILSEARKYGLYLIMAEQSPSQQEYMSTNQILANTGNLVCFRTASPNDSRLLLPSFKDSIDRSDLINLPAYNFYLKTTAKQVLPPTSGRTYPLQAAPSFLKDQIHQTKATVTSPVNPYKVKSAM